MDRWVDGSHGGHSPLPKTKAKRRRNRMATVDAPPNHGTTPKDRETKGRTPHQPHPTNSTIPRLEVRKGAHLLEVGAAGVDLVDEILHADDAVLAQLLHT